MAWTHPQELARCSGCGGLVRMPCVLCRATKTPSQAVRTYPGQRYFGPIGKTSEYHTPHESPVKIIKVAGVLDSLQGFRAEAAEYA